MLTYTQTQHLNFISISSHPSLYHKHESQAHYIGASAEMQDIFTAVAGEINREVYRKKKKKKLATYSGLSNQPYLTQIGNTELLLVLIRFLSCNIFLLSPFSAFYFSCFSLSSLYFFYCLTFHFQQFLIV